MTSSNPLQTQNQRQMHNSPPLWPLELSTEGSFPNQSARPLSIRPAGRTTPHYHRMSYWSPSRPTDQPYLNNSPYLAAILGRSSTAQRTLNARRSC
ncbi:hypothetical protein RvY_02196-4 [Ramazzottius varieornatus]|uniref:Uncharacterized protein n=1 Tax=Ramazzottius varieornatus TaxID=947166 RepID=A0A1D1UIW5_RAMVA|nr:hypothetical protein RvY_02196-4 [Ramazzottius varieornatus]